MNYFAIPGIKYRPKIRRDITPEQINAAVCGYFGLSPELTKKKSRKRDVVEAKYVAIWLIRKYNRQITLVTIGQHFGGLDHTTVMYGIRQINRFLKIEDRSISSAIRFMENEIDGYSTIKTFSA